MPKSETTSRLNVRFRAVVQACAILSFGAPLSVAMASLSGVGHRWVDILAQFPAPALTATLAATLVLGVARFKVATLFGVLASALLIIAMWPQVAPSGPRPDPNAPVVRLYAANLYAMNDDVAAMRASIAAAEADIVVLVEFGQAPAAAIEDLLPDHPHRQVTEPIVRQRDSVRSVIASRHPLTSRTARHAGREMTAAVIDTPIGPIHVVGVHLTRPWPFQFQWAQLIQTQNLIQYIGEADEPVVLAGDFNSVTAGRVGRMLRREGGMVHAPGWPGTWPSALPAPLRMTIDQVYHSPEIAVVSRRLGRRTGSDHHPVIVDLTRTLP